MNGRGVCLLLESYAPLEGGTEREARALAEGLMRGGIPTFVVTLQNHATLPVQEWIEGVEVHRVAPGYGRWLGLFPVLTHLARNRHRYDLIFVAPFRTLGLSAALAGLLFRKRLVFRAQHDGEMSGAFFDHGLANIRWSHHTPAFRLLNGMRTFILRRADRFVAATRVVRREFLQYGVRRHAAQIIPNAVDTRQFHPASPEEKARLRAALTLPTDAEIVLFAAPLARSQGVLTLLDAWRALSGKSSRLLVLVGSGGRDAERCEAEVRERIAAGPAGRVLLQTDQTRVADYMRAADVYVLPLLEPNSSFADGVARAMSCGLAVVTTPVEGLSDVIRAGVNALTISPGDTAGLSTALLELLEHPAHRARLGAAAAEGSRAFAADAILARYLAMFAEILPGDQSVRLGRSGPALPENLHAVAPGR